MLSQNFAKSIFVSTPAQRSLLNTHFQVVSPVLCNMQQRQMGAKHAPKFEKGKIKFKHNEKMKKLKDMSDSARKEYEKMRQKTRQILWEPKTDVEAIYKKYMLDMQFNPRKPYTDRIVYEMLEKVQSEQDFSLALRIWRVLLYRNVDIAARTSQKIVDLFISLMKDFKSVVEIVRNAKTLNMSFSRDHVHQVMGILIANGNMDDAVTIFKSILAHGQAFQPATEDFFFAVSQFNKANDFAKTTEVYTLPITGGDPATHMSKHFVPTYAEVIKACVATENVELAVRVREEALRTGVAADAPMFKDNAEFFQKANETKQ